MMLISKEVNHRIQGSRMNLKCSNVKEIYYIQAYYSNREDNGYGIED